MPRQGGCKFSAWTMLPSLIKSHSHHDDEEEEPPDDGLDDEIQMVEGAGGTHSIPFSPTKPTRSLSGGFLRNASLFRSKKSDPGSGKSMVANTTGVNLRFIESVVKLQRAARHVQEAVPRRTG